MKHCGYLSVIGSVNLETGVVIIVAGRVYFRGAVREVGSPNFTLPTDTSVVIGVWYNETTITELEDPFLRDPTIAIRNYGEPG